MYDCTPTSETVRVRVRLRLISLARSPWLFVQQSVTRFVSSEASSRPQRLVYFCRLSETKIIGSTHVR